MVSRMRLALASRIKLAKPVRTARKARTGHEFRFRHDPSHSDVRDGEIAVALPERSDASVYFIGRIRTPWKARKECPKNARAARETGVVCTIELDPRWEPALHGHRALLAPRRVLLDGQGAARSRGPGAGPSRQGPRHLCAALAGAAEPDRHERGQARQGRRQHGSRWSALDCLDGTPLLDIKPYFASTDSIPDAVTGV